ncbi:MAG: MBL fold metallo-hydrolase [Myxococcota bacterium]
MSELFPLQAAAPAVAPPRSRRVLPQLGAHPTGLRLERIQSSPRFIQGVAQNPVATEMLRDVRKMLPLVREYFQGRREQEPSAPLPVVRPDLSRATARAPGVRVTWLGHSTMLVNVDGHLVLTDPVFSRRASPFQWSGPARFHPTPLTIDELPPLDAVLISHDHYDHLDHLSVLQLARRGHRFVTALGVGAHLEAWGVPAERIVELDWWESVDLGGLNLVAAPARHFSGRTSAGGNRTLWASWALVGARHRVWFSGDTGPFDGVREIGARLGPFDLTMIETGAHHPAWGNIHLGPDEAARMHGLVRGGALLPVHWGTFNLALHAWDEPIVRMQQLAEQQSIPLLAPVAGETVDPRAPAVAAPWRERLRLRSR